MGLLQVRSLGSIREQITMGMSHRWHPVVSKVVAWLLKCFASVLPRPDWHYRDNYSSHFLASALLIRMAEQHEPTRKL